MITSNNDLIIKSTSSCNFSCTFCSSKNLNIPTYNKVPQILKNYIIKNNYNRLIVTGGEPLTCPQTYFEDLISFMESSFKENYEINLTSNMVLWYKNPEKYDYLFNNPHITADTSFQYGSDRKDENIYTEERFIDLYNKFYNRYKKSLLFTYVVNENNEKYVKKACLLAKKLNTNVKFNCQLPLGLSNYYYPRYKLLSIFLDLLKENIIDKDSDIIASLKKHNCPFSLSYKYCKYNINKAVYVNNAGELIESSCEERLSSSVEISIKKDMLFNKCVFCPMFPLCNGCSINREYLKPIKEENCKWMKDHYYELKKYNLI